MLERSHLLCPTSASPETRSSRSMGEGSIRSTASSSAGRGTASALSEPVLESRSARALPSFTSSRCRMENCSRRPPVTGFSRLPATARFPTSGKNSSAAFRCPLWHTTRQFVAKVVRVLRKHFQVLRTVVVTNPISVVHDFLLKKAPSQLLLRYENVLRDVYGLHRTPALSGSRVVRTVNHHISIAVDYPSSVPVWVTLS